MFRKAFQVRVQLQEKRRPGIVHDSDRNCVRQLWRIGQSAAPALGNSNDGYLAGKRIGGALRPRDGLLQGAKDTYKNCCLLSTIQTIASGAKELGLPFDLVVYPDVAASPLASRVAAPAAPMWNGVGSTGSAPPVNMTSAACVSPQPAISRIVRSASFGVVMIL